MAVVIDQEVMCTGAFMLEENKMLEKDDDAASTASGASSDQVSLPSSPGASEMASLPSSPAKVHPNAALVTPESLADLPSLGSFGHFAGLCSRCCFHAKGRCQNGKDCRFCHFEHEKRQRKKKVLPYDGRNSALTGPVAPMARTFPVAPFVPPPGLESVPFEAMPLLPRELSPMAPPMPLVTGQHYTSPALTLPPQGQQQDVENWSVERVVHWLSASGLGHLSRSFEDHRITGDVLLDLSQDDLDEIGICAFGDKKRLLRGVGQLRSEPQLALQPQFADQQFLGPCPPPPPLPPPCWEAPLFETHHFCAQGPCPPPAPPPFMALYQCPPPAPPSFNAPM